MKKQTLFALGEKKPCAPDAAGASIRLRATRNTASTRSPVYANRTHVTKGIFIWKHYKANPPEFQVHNAKKFPRRTILYNPFKRRFVFTLFS